MTSVDYGRYVLIPSPCFGPQFLLATIVAVCFPMLLFVGMVLFHMCRVSPFLMEVLFETVLRTSFAWVPFCFPRGYGVKNAQTTHAWCDSGPS